VVVARPTPGKRQLFCGRKDLNGARVSVNEHRFGVAQLVRERLAIVALRDAATVEHHAEGVAVRTVLVAEDAQHLDGNHEVRGRLHVREATVHP